MKEFKVTNIKKKGALALSSTLKEGKTLMLHLGKGEELTSTEYAGYKKSITMFKKYLTINKLSDEEKNKTEDDIETEVETPVEETETAEEETETTEEETETTEEETAPVEKVKKKTKRKTTKKKRKKKKKKSKVA